MPAVDSLPQLASFIFLILYSLLRFYHLRLPNSTHGQTDPFFVQIHADDFYIHNISYADNFQRMFDIFVTDLRNVYHPGVRRYLRMHQNRSRFLQFLLRSYLLSDLSYPVHRSEGSVLAYLHGGHVPDGRVL